MMYRMPVSSGQVPLRPTGPVRPAQPIMGGTYQAPTQGPMRPMPRPMLRGSFKKGGKVRKTGAYMLHKGEKVVPLKSMRRASDGGE